MTFNRLALRIFLLLLPLYCIGHDDGGLHFIANQGQWSSHIQYQTPLPSGMMFIEENGFAYHFFDGEVIASAHGADSAAILPKFMQHHGLFMRFSGSNLSNPIQPTEKIDGYYNFYIGRNQSRWQSHVPGYQRLRYNELYPGISLELYANHATIKYDVFVAPGADASQFALQYEGADKLELSHGNLLVQTSLGELMEEKPIAWQLINGNKVDVPCRYTLNGNEVRFEFPKGYNTAYELVIDPTLLFSTYSGSFANNFGYTATFDSEGFLYSGSTAFFNSINYPTTAGAYQTTFAGGESFIGGTDVAITKYDTSGTFMVYSTLIGGVSDEMPHSLVVNRYDELYVYGTTGSADYPVTATAYDTSFAGGIGAADLQSGLGVLMSAGSDAFVSAFSNDGTALKASTLLGGSNHDGLNFSIGLTYNYADEVRGEVLIDRNNNVFVASCTMSDDFPTTPGAFQPTYGGGPQDGFVAKLDESLTTLIFSSYFGGELDDAIYSIALDENNRAYLAGGTQSDSLHVDSNAVQPTTTGNPPDGFVAIISADGTNLLRSTYWGTPAYEQCFFVELDRFNNVHLFGQSRSPGSPFIINAGYGQPYGGQFISKLTPQLDSVIWSTQFGEPDSTATGFAWPDVSPTAFLVDLCSKIYLSGWGSPIQGGNLSTTGLDVTIDAYDNTTTGGDFYLFVMEDDASALSWASFYGGDQSTEHVDGGTSRFDRKGRIYQSVCAGCGGNDDFPIKPDPGAVSAVNNNSCNNGVFKMDFNLPIVVADFTAPGIGCVPFQVDFANHSLEQSATTYQWFFGDGDTSTVFEPTHVYDSAGVFDVMLVVNDTATCNLADTLVLPIRVLADTSYNLASVLRCDSSLVQIGLPPAAGNGFSYTWTPKGTLTDTSVSNPYAFPDSTTMYTLLLSNGVCTDTLYQTVQVSVDLAVDFSTPSLPCNTGTVQFQPTGNYQPSTTYLWSFGDGSTDTAFAPSHTYATAGNYTVTLFTADSLSCNGGDTNSAVLTIFVDSTLTLAQQDICINDSVAIGVNPQPGVTYQWIPGTGLSDSTAANPLAFPNTTTQYTLLASDSVCTDTIFQTVDVSPQLVAEFVQPPPICVPDTIALTAGGILYSGTTISWLVNGTPFATGTNAQLVLTAAGTYTVQAVYADSATCIPLDTATQLVTALSDSSYTLPTAVRCAADGPVTIGPAQPDTSLIYLWSPANGLSATNVPNPEAAPGTTTQYTLIAGNGICADTIRQTVTVVSFTANATGDTTLCAGSSANLNATATQPIQHWIWAQQPNDTLNANTSLPQFAPAPDSNATYFLTAIDANGCTARDTVQVTVQSVEISVADTALCIGDTVQLSATAQQGTNLSWSWQPGSAIAGPTNQQTVSISPQGGTALDVTATDNIGCSATAQALVLVGELLETDVLATADNDTIPRGTSTTLHAFPAGNNTYLWEPGNTLSNETDPNPVASPLVTTSYAVDVTDPTGLCTYKGEVIVHVYEFVCGEPEIFVPNAFTPNNDAENDILFVRGRNIDEVYFAVYNRWGERVFETRTKDVGWDGMFKGMKADPGVFVYYLEVTCVDGQQYFHKGNVTLFR